MRHERPRSVFRDERGIALPLALIVLTLLTSLTVAFLGLSSTEPTIAANLKRGETALALAEAGIERGIWALSYPGSSGVTANPAATPYDGQQLLALAGGGYTIAITAGPTPADRILTAHGYVPRNGVALPAPPAALAQSDIAAHRAVRLQVRAGAGNGLDGNDNTVAGPAKNLPGALTVAGTLEMGGNSLVDGSSQSDGTPNNCAKKGGVTIRDKTTLSDGTEVDNTITLKGSASALGTPAQQEFGYDDFAQYQFGTAQLAALKALAQAEGTYIHPTSNSQFNLN
ncbi:MAG: pilus assembly PilX family protein, partial [bacterium]